MANPFFTAFNRSAPKGNNIAASLIENIQNFKGDPCKILQDKINSGQISQQQYNQLYGMAQTIVSNMMSVLHR